MATGRVGKVFTVLRFLLNLLVAAIQIMGIVRRRRERKNAHKNISNGDGDEATTVVACLECGQMNRVRASRRIGRCDKCGSTITILNTAP